MRSKAIGPLATLLTIVSILAIPLLAIFGIPQFVPVVASPAFAPFESMSDGTNEIQKMEPVDFRGRDIFAPVTNGSRETFQRPETAADFGWTGPLGQEPAQPLAVSATATNRLVGTRSESQFSIGRPTLLATSSAEPSRIPSVSLSSDPTGPDDESQTFREAPFTWRQAMIRLNAFGIDQFRLQPGAQPGMFHFCCYLRPTDDSRVSIRFESEATEPLRAVKAVLDQVRQWDQMR